MMPSTPQCASRRQPGRTRRRAGFTLTEMLVVIGIVVLVLSIATPMVTRAWRAGDRTRTAADLAAVASALEAYKTDHGDYPRTSPTNVAFTGGPSDFNGARMLCRALIAPGPATAAPAAHAQIADGAGPVATAGGAETLPGPGFRTRGASGPVYGPYLPTDRFKTADPTEPPQTLPGRLAIMDRYNRPILYYPAMGKPNIRLAKAYVWDRTGSERPMYNALDNWSATQNTGAMPKGVLSLMLGDLNADGMIGTGEEPATELPYLLWSAGPDETYGPPQGMPTNTPQAARKAVEKSDDVTNFRN